MNYLIAIGVALLVAPIGGIFYFLIAQYRRKFSIGKYVVLLFCYALVWLLTVYASTSRVIDMIVFVVIHLVLLLLGLFLERVAFVEELKSIMRK